MADPQRQKTIIGRRGPRLADIRRIVRGALEGGAPQVEIELDGARFTILATAPVTSGLQAAAIEDRMREAFGE